MMHPKHQHIQHLLKLFVQLKKKVGMLLVLAGCTSMVSYNMPLRKKVFSAQQIIKYFVFLRVNNSILLKLNVPEFNAKKENVIEQTQNCVFCEYTFIRIVFLNNKILLLAPLKITFEILIMKLPMLVI